MNQDIRLVILDVDGVLTDGRIHLSSDGQESQTFSVRDGYGIRQLLRCGIEVAVISARPSPAADRRLQELGVRHIYLACDDKEEAYNHLLQSCSLTAAKVAYMGDDIPDRAVMRLVGLPCAPADACAEIKAVATWIASANGGYGAVRELCEKILHQQQLWDRIEQ